jgi:hypothetical protein
MHNEDLHSLYSSSNVTMIESIAMTVSERRLKTRKNVSL